MTIPPANGQRPPLRGTAAKRRRVRGILTAPAKISTFYLLSTFAVFLLSNLSDQVQNMLALCLFVLASYTGWYLGCLWGAAYKFTPHTNPRIKLYGNSDIQLILIWLSCAYYVAWSINQIYEFGGLGIGSVISAILSPGDAYKAKFDVYEYRVLTGRVSLPTQLLVLSSFLYAIGVPLGINAWNRMRKSLRIAFLFSIFIYVVGFLFIGTMKGVGDIFLLSVAGLGVMLAKQNFVSETRFDRLKVAAAVGVAVPLLFLYMTNSQIDRAEAFGIRQSSIVGDVSDTLLAKSLGDKAAYGVYSVLAYPSHGYLGLSFNLQQPYTFSYGAGLSQAMESYRQQFFGGQSNLDLTYPYRTQAATGWPAGMSWSTVFPWIASDTSFFLVPLFMLAMGFVFSRVWIACVYGSSILALAALGQFVIFIAFIPANNQVLMQRQGLWIVITILALGIVNYGKKRA